MTYYIIQFLSLSIPAAIIFFCYLPYRKKVLAAMNLQSNILRELSLIIYVMLIAGIIALKLWPVYYREKTPGVWGNILLLVDRPSLDMLVNLVPFGSIADIQEWINWGTANLHDITISSLERAYSFHVQIYFSIVTYSSCAFEFEVIQIQLFVFSLLWTALGCRPQGTSRIQIPFWWSIAPH